MKILAGVYVVLAASLFTGLYDPLTQGRDDSWAIAAMAGLSQVALGMAVRRVWALLAPAVLAVAGFLADGAEGVSWLILIAGLPAGVGAAGAGWAIGRALGDRALVAATAVMAVAALPSLWATTETVQRARAEELPRAVQAQLPLELSLGNLCPEAETPPDEARDVERRAEVMIRELRRRPGWLVTDTAYSEDEPGGVRESITVRELAQEQLSDLTNGGQNCRPDLQRRIRDALG